MASGGTGSEVVRRNTTDLLPHDVKEIDTVYQYANKQENKMKQLTKTADNMGILKKIWDSKVPEMNKTFYHFFCLKQTNPEQIKIDIQKYLEFYQLLSEAVNKLKGKNGKSEGQTECKAKTEEGTENDKDVYSLILDLYENLTRLAKEAQTGKKSTGSSTVYDLHQNFIRKHEKLENMIKRVECVSLKQGWKKAIDGLNQSTMAVESLKQDLKTSEHKYDRMCNKFDELFEQNKNLIKQQHILLEENAKIMQTQQKLLEDNKTMKHQTDLLIQVIAAMAKEKEQSKKDNEKDD